MMSWQKVQGDWQRIAVILITTLVTASGSGPHLPPLLHPPPPAKLFDPDFRKGPKPWDVSVGDFRPLPLTQPDAEDTYQSMGSNDLSLSEPRVSSIPMQCQHFLSNFRVYPYILGQIALKG